MYVLREAAAALLVMGWGSSAGGLSVLWPSQGAPHPLTPMGFWQPTPSLFLGHGGCDSKREGRRESRGGMAWTHMRFWRAVSMVPSPLCLSSPPQDAAHDVPVLPCTELQGWRGHHALWCQNCLCWGVH